MFDPIAHVVFDPIAALISPPRVVRSSAEQVDCMSARKDVVVPTITPVQHDLPRFGQRLQPAMRKASQSSFERPGPLLLFAGGITSFSASQDNLRKGGIDTAEKREKWLERVLRDRCSRPEVSCRHVYSMGTRPHRLPTRPHRLPIRTHAHATRTCHTRIHTRTHWRGGGGGPPRVHTHTCVVAEAPTAHASHPTLLTPRGRSRRRAPGCVAREAMGGARYANRLRGHPRL